MTEQKKSERAEAVPEDLTEIQAGVLSCIQAQPEPRTPTEIVRNYPAEARLNGWPEIDEAQVKSTITALVKRGDVTEGDEAPPLDGEKKGEKVLVSKGEGAAA